jgi:hypothetical protein
VSTPNFKDGKTTTKPALLFLLRRYKKKRRVITLHSLIPRRLLLLPRAAGPAPILCPPASTTPHAPDHFTTTPSPPAVHRHRIGLERVMPLSLAQPLLLRAAPPRAPAPPPRGGVRAAARGGGGGGWPSSPCRDRLRRALRREGRLPQLCALRARSHSGSAYYSNWDSNRKFNNRFCIWFESTFGGSPCVFSQPASSLLILTLTHHVPPFFMEMHRERISSSAATTSTLL